MRVYQKFSGILQGGRLGDCFFVLHQRLARLQPSCTASQSGVLIKDKEVLLHALVAEFPQRAKRGVRI